MEDSVYCGEAMPRIGVRRCAADSTWSRRVAPVDACRQPKNNAAMTRTRAPNQSSTISRGEKKFGGERALPARPPPQLRGCPDSGNRLLKIRGETPRITRGLCRRCYRGVFFFGQLRHALDEESDVFARLTLLYLLLLIFLLFDRSRDFAAPIASRRGWHRVSPRVFQTSGRREAQLAARRDDRSRLQGVSAGSAGHRLH